jgi:hypothetical protein
MPTRADWTCLRRAWEESVVNLMPVINSVRAWEVFAVESKLFDQIAANSLAIQRRVKYLTHWLLSLM